jgi:two-component system, LuxR family, response regulator FixJ
VSATIHIVDDDPAVRDSLATLLSRHGFATRSFASGRSFLDVAQPSASGCIIIDLKMPGMSGLVLLHEMRARKIELPAVFVTGHGDIAAAVEAMKAGAIDFLEKPFSNAAILEAIDSALGRAAAADPAETHGRLQALTARERDVLEHLTTGMSSREIGERLGISARTVDVHRGNLLTKLGARNTADLIRIVVTARHAGKA